MTQQLTKDDLRGCPFCGGLGDIEQIESGCFGVGCQDCDFQLMNGTIGLGWHKSESDAIRAWNERNSDLCIQGLQDWTKKLQSSLDAANSRIAELEQGKCLHQIAEPAASQSALVEALRAVCTDMVAIGNGQHAITEEARNKVEALQGVLFAAAPQAVQPSVPDGWKLVPMEPQDMQQVAGAQAIRLDTTVINKMWTANKVYREMVAAAPAHPAEGVPAQAESLLALARNMVRTALDADNKTEVQEIKAAIEAEVDFERALRVALAATLPAAQGLDAWISVKDQLPEIHEWQKGSIAGISDLVLTCNEFDPDSLRAQYLRKGGCGDLTTLHWEDSPTHWMKAPALAAQANQEGEA